MDKYFHSVVLDHDKCNGCTNCMRRCPTEAIRVRNKKAVIIKERCIDCGECIRVCPFHAQNSITDDLERLNEFKYNIAIPSVSLYGQFGIDTDMDMIFQGIKGIGFDYVFDEGRAADIVTMAIKETIRNKTVNRPIISSLCPGTLRLIQARYPSLIDNIIRIESPMEVAARLARDFAINQVGLKSEEVGVFYLTPCPAKVTSINQPLGIRESNLDGAISIKKVYGDIIKKAKASTSNSKFEKASPLGIGWARVGGQSYAIGVDNYIAVDGIENVIKVLEEIELGKLNNIDYFEGLACVGGCVGGPLNVENPFVAKSRIRILSESSRPEQELSSEYIDELWNKGLIGWTESINPKETMTLDNDIQKAILKIEQIKSIYKDLPGLDCGSCGAPTCNALAEDIVRGYGNINDCIFKLREKFMEK